VRNHTLTLYVRSPGKLPQDIKDNANVTVIQGGFDADLETIRPAITSGAEAIVSTAGPIATNNGTGTVSSLIPPSRLTARHINVAECCYCNVDLTLP